MIVVQQQMVIAAKENSVINIRLAAIPSPMEDVVSFAPSRRTVTIAPHAPAVSCRKGLSLAGVIQTVLAPDIQWPPIR